LIQVPFCSNCGGIALFFRAVLATAPRVESRVQSSRLAPQLVSQLHQPIGLLQQPRRVCPGIARTPALPMRRPGLGILSGSGAIRPARVRHRALAVGFPEKGRSGVARGSGSPCCAGSGPSMPLPPPVGPFAIARRGPFAFARPPDASRLDRGGCRDLAHEPLPSIAPARLWSLGRVVVRSCARHPDQSERAEPNQGPRRPSR
jgi:hypothetical protein